MRVTHLAAILLVSASSLVRGAIADDFAAARARARTESKLILLEFGAEWCSGCKVFARDVRSVPELQLALAAIVFLPVDAEKGEGALLTKKFGVQGLPTFVLTTSQGEAVDRWTSYGKPAGFTSRLSSALTDPSTIDEKMARLERAPTAAGAARLAEIRISESNLRAGVELFRRARGLDPHSPGGYMAEIFTAMETGYLAGRPGFGADSLQAAADGVLAAKPADPAQLLRVAATMRALAARQRDPQHAAPYLAAAVAATAKVTDPGLLEQRRALLPDHALFVEKDVRKAARLQREIQPAGWREDPAKLNDYAWWCFQHDVNLDEAEKLARRGVRLAPRGRDKAMLLDTLAEIRARRGDPRQAASLAEQAAREAPESIYYPKQVARFRKAAGSGQ